MQRKPRTVLVVATIGLCIGCTQQSASVHSATAVGLGVGVRESAVVTAANLSSGGESRSVLAALQQARPWFLLGTRGRVPAVFLDESLMTDISILSTLSVSDICEIRLQRATSGAGHVLILSNGDVSSGDVLLVRTRRIGTTDCRGDLVSLRRLERGSYESAHMNDSGVLVSAGENLVSAAQ